MTTIYGIKNCDTMKKAIKWLNDHGIAYEFHDFKKQELEQAELKSWVDAIGWEVLVNSRGTTWRRLPDTDRQDIDQSKAINLMLANLSLIKRPVLKVDGQIHVGFKPDQYQAIFG